MSSRTMPININMTNNMTNNTNNHERTLSQDFDLISPDSKNIILGFTNGAKPTSQYRTLYLKTRSDSIEHSPVTKSLLNFYGIKHVKNTYKD